MSDPMPRILYRHIVADLCRIMLLTASVLVTVIAFGAAIRPIMQNLFGAEDLLQFVALASVPMLQFALPFAGAFAGTIVYARLAADNEVLAMSAAGMSYRRVFMPAVLLGLLLFVGMVLLVDLGVPRLWSSMDRFKTRDPTRLFVSAVERGEALALPGTTTQLYADEVRVLELSESSEGGAVAPSTRLGLAGVAAVEFGADGSPVTEFTAEFATVDIYRDDESAYLKLLFRNATAFRDGEDALVVVPLAEPDAIDLGKGIRLKPKHLDFRGLLALWGDIDGYHEVSELRRRTERALEAVDRWECIARQLSEGDGVLRLADAGGRRSYEVRGAKLVGTKLLPNSREPLELVELERGVASRRASVDEASLVADERARDGALRFELLARADTVADLRGIGGGGRWPPRIAGLEPASCTMRARSSDSVDALVAEATSLDEAPRGSPALSAQRAARDSALAMVEAARSVRADIVARIVQRINQSLSAPLMIVLGAVLAVALRGTNPLQVYLLSFLPAILAILLVSGGEQMLKEKTTFLGVLVASLGNIGLLSMIVFAARKVARH
jgi:lipopolysaccharide export system permease protein